MKKDRRKAKENRIESSLEAEAVAQSARFAPESGVGAGGAMGTPSDTVLHSEASAGDDARSGLLGRCASALRSASARIRSFAAAKRKLLLGTVLPAVYTLLLGGCELSGGIYPFGVAAVCAAPAGIPALTAAAGAVMASLFVRGGFFIAVTSAAAVAAVTLIHKLRGFASESAALRGGLSVLLGSAQAVIFSVSDGIGFYELCGIFLSAAVCPVLTVSLRGVFFASAPDTPSSEAGVCALLYSAAYLLRLISPPSASLSVVLTFLCVIFCVYLYGIHRGALIGIVLGLAAPPEYSFVYVTAAVGSGVLMSISPTAAVIVGAVLAMAFGICSAGAAAVGDLLPELIFCTSVAAPLLHYGIIPTPRARATSFSELAEVERGRYASTRRRISALSDGLGAISAVLGRVARRFCRPSLTELRQLCDGAFDESCRDCGDRYICWDREYRATAASVGELAAAVRGGKPVCDALLPEGLRSRCAHTDEILSRVRIAAARARTSSDSTAILAEDYGIMSRLIGGISDGDGEYEPDTQAARALSARLGRIGVGAPEVSVYGKRRRQVFVRGLEHGCGATGEELRAAAGSVLGCAMSVPEYRIDGRQVIMSLHTAERFRAEAGCGSAAKRGERSGDSMTSFRRDDGRFYVLISDGMGSGGEAALISGISSMLLEKLLVAGAPVGAAMELLGSLLSGRREECFATVDLMEADLVTGELSFIKSGAAPSFVLRGGKLFRLSSHTVPMGILTPFDAEQLRFTAEAGDLVIMISDGVLPDGEDDTWLCELLCGGASPLTSGCDLSAAAVRIAELAAHRANFGDDISVGIVEISEAER